MGQFLKGKDVILLASSNYYTLGKSKLNVHFIAEEFAKQGTKVLFVESLGLKDISIFGKSDIYKTTRRIFDFIHLMFFGPRNPLPNLFIISLLRLPYDKYEIISKINQLLISFSIRRYSKKYLNKKPIIWSFLPTLSYLKQSVPNSAFIYHNVDNYSAVPFVDKSYVVRSERQTLRKADIVFTVSASRVEEFSEFTESPIIYLNNVANFELFNKAQNEEFLPPKDINEIIELGRPVVGYIGNLAGYKEDINLLTETVKLATDYSFVFVGPIGEGDMTTNISKLKALKNAYFLGSKEYEEIYKYVKYFDVAMIPRRNNAAGEGGFPMKYFEFLAAGIPTVVTGVGNLNQFTKLGRLGGVANTPEQFIKKFEYWITLKRRDPKEYEEAIKERVKLAKHNSWTKRIEQLNKLASTIIKP